MNLKNCFLRIFITESALKDAVTGAIIEKYPGRIQKVVPDDYDISEDVRGMDPKRVLYLTHSKGDVVKGCPGTAESYLCCNYQVINQTQNCPMNCVYCILQFYLNQPATILFTNFDDIFIDLKEKLSRQPKRFFRIGTGELGDSLAISGSVFFADQAIRTFADVPNALLELKTKTSETDGLLNIPHKGHTVLAWSINPQEIIHRYEFKTSQLIPRLTAAARAGDAGYLLAFHLDPILAVPGWEDIYNDLLDELYLHIPSERIAWISMGSLRYPPSMKDKMIERYPSTTLPFGEMIRGMDGKMRYARPVRVPMYKFIYQKLRGISNPPFIYFCMESRDVWEEVTGTSPESNAHLDYLFAESLYKRFAGLMAEKPVRDTYKRGFSLEQIPNLDKPEL